jgi:hypothetical protein
LGEHLVVGALKATLYFGPDAGKFWGAACLTHAVVLGAAVAILNKMSFKAETRDSIIVTVVRRNPVRLCLDNTLCLLALRRQKIIFAGFA